MLRQTEQLFENKRNFEDEQLYQNNDELLPIKEAMGWSAFSHAIISLIIWIAPLILLLLGFNLDLFNKPHEKVRDIEFVLVNQPEETPINKNTPLRADRNTRAGGIHDPHKKIAPPQPALPNPKPEQMNNKSPKKILEKIVKPKTSTPKQVNKTVQKTAVQKSNTQVQPKTKTQTQQQKPAPPKPNVKPSIPPTKAPTSMKLPIPPTRGTNKISMPQGPVSTRPNGKYGTGGGSGASPKPIAASGGYGTSGSRMPSNRGTGAGSSYSPGGGNSGNPGPGNPHGRPGVDAVREPNFGPYMSELSRRIKSNWDPPRGEESKRVVLLFTIARDGRLLNVKVLKSSGAPSADRAALAAVELSAPFRPLPSDFRGPNVDIQFTFDYNVLGVKRF